MMKSSLFRKSSLFWITIFLDTNIMIIRLFREEDKERWDAYVAAAPLSNCYHRIGWKRVIEKSYRHKTYYLLAERSKGEILGILPLVHMKSILGNNLISIPFFDLGGILADDRETEHALLNETIRIGRSIKAGRIELRHAQPLSCLNGPILNNGDGQENYGTLLNFTTNSTRVRMLLPIPESPDLLMQGFKSKLRSQIKKPIQEGLYYKIGGMGMLDDFYDVFTVNMRDLGSPVHAKRMLINVLEEFSDDARVIIVYRHNEPLACGIIVGFKNTLENPWASSLRTYSKLSPNMLLYWGMLEYACSKGFRFFDFGRSLPGEGTFKFKEQWGAQPLNIYWDYITTNGKIPEVEMPEKTRYHKAIKYWQKLPVFVTRIAGPMIRKNIGL